ncbi:PspC domain-containing protein [Aeromicrobium sp. UC242_57]|uniref:PspC domain-containing protein n=1 Tax=Aeromicrobium sp. UC242_57 TaxID=3374624 RepID=UPI0037BA8E48
MNDTQQSPPPSGPDDDFDARKLRSITDMRRSKDDRIIAGVCSGAARYLNVDPVVIRVLLAVLTLAGFAGAIIYLAAWFLLPSEGAEKSVAADWLKLDKNEEQVRVAGMIGAVVLAVLSAVGDGSWSWWGDAPWWIVPFALLAYFFWIRPRRRREARQAAAAPEAVHYSAATGSPTQVMYPAAPPKPRKSHALLALTASLTLIALAATWIYEETQKDLPWTTYVAVALGVVALGLLVGTFFGNGGGLIAIGCLLAVALALGSLIPEGGVGRDRQVPSTASEVESAYKHGVGEFELDLTQVDDLSALHGRTVTLRLGIGHARVLVPRGLDVDIESHVAAGDIQVFGRNANGTDIDLNLPSTSQPALTIDISQRIGQIEVIRR